MTFKNFVCKGILVFAGLLLLGWLGKYIYMVDGEIDWFRFMLVYGVPVGIPHMFIIIPWHWDLSGILGMAALCVIVGGVFGCLIAAWFGIRYGIWWDSQSARLWQYIKGLIKNNSMKCDHRCKVICQWFYFPFIVETRCDKICIKI